MDQKQKLSALRALMKKRGMAAYVQPVHDEYMSEYPPACNRRVEWLTGFSGSAGTAVVLAEKAAFFTDGRYTLQAQTQIDGALFEPFNSGEMVPEKWLADNCPHPNPLPKGEGIKVGYDAHLYTKSAVKRMEAALKKKDIALVAVPNLVDAIWGDRPPAPATDVFIHEVQYSGEESLTRRSRMAREINADAAIIAAPDAVCWLLNIRARDVENTPLLLATAILEANGHVQLYVAPSRVHADVREHLGEGVMLCDPAMLEGALKNLGKEKKRVLCDPGSAPVWFTLTLSEAGAQIVEAADPCVLAKATKNPVELGGIRAAHIRDGVAVSKCLHWVDKETKKREVTEIELSEKLLAFRAVQEGFLEPSFTTIAGSGSHGAIVHYRVTPESNRTLKQGELLLLDSGGQYPDGTTDITRTVAIGEPTPEHKNRFTLVLKGHIAIATATFPEGTSGSQLDALARQYLWAAGLDYDHGTGHGVGQFLGVHEGPQRISKRGGDAKLKPGMIVSNEPGYYKAGEYGIRIENLVAVVAAEEKFLRFETVTCAPLDTRLVDAAMLNAAEKAWLNDYHAWVFTKLADSMDAPERAWLTECCRAI